MYSLYRAWLMRDAVAAASLAAPPDVIVNVGSTSGHQFIAHRNLISIHSGYLKALIQNEVSSPAGAGLLTITVPSIAPDTFAPLLSFMYTGYLDLNHDNIYSILLATHLLHMPRALDLCRTYLVQNQVEMQQRTSQSSYLMDLSLPAPAGAVTPVPLVTARNIIKPIPSKKAHDFSKPGSGGVWNPINVPRLSLQTAPDGAFQAPDKLQVAQEPEKYLERVEGEEEGEEGTEGVREELAARRRRQNEEEVEEERQRPSTSREEVVHHDRRTNSVSPCPSSTNSCTSSDDRTVHVIKSPKRKLKQATAGAAATTSDENNGNRVVIDVACCDGPVRFHRVLNQSYGQTQPTPDTDNRKQQQQQQLSGDEDQEYLNNYPKARFLNSKTSERKFKDYMHQQLVNSRNGHTQQHQQSDENENSSTESDPDKIYTCKSCSHTFKSQYCYQKHVRRHINPVVEGATPPAPPTTPQAVVTSHNKREVRLLDMNVQYYPCKTCGSKFPSYYFVHKHRKLCHNGEDDAKT